ncbi:MAG: domain containing protein [Verrucomicrobiaceae bacterium]|nr:domain containing protein [Verrucomicrobiaceae bacterium]
MNHFSAKPLSVIHTEISLARPAPTVQPQITLDSPASTLFTDFTKTQAVSVLATTQIDDALQQMIVVGVRLLFVTDREFKLLGLVTSYDIAGEKPLLYMQSRDAHFNSEARASIQVQHIMQPISAWRTLDFHAIERAKVGDIVETFKSAGLRHLVILQQGVTDDGVDETAVRGLFSARQFERALRINFDTLQRPNTFAELERTLDHPTQSPLFESNPFHTLSKSGHKWG